MVSALSEAAPKLVYLPFRAMAETTRMLFAYGGVPYKDEAVWGRVFQDRRHNMNFPWGKTPALELGPGVRTVAQSGALARYAAKRAGAYPQDAVACALNDSVYELAQELCTINPLVNCFVGRQFQAIRHEYFSHVLPPALVQLEMELVRAQAGADRPFFVGHNPSHGDFNVFHHLDNAMLLEPDILHKHVALSEWFERMRGIPQLKEYLEKRPVLNGIGENPGLEDRHGVRVTQRNPQGHAWLVDGCWIFDA